MAGDMRTRMFQKAVLGYYQAYGRHDLPWRLPDSKGRFEPYRIMVSEIMLQQTQVKRVIPKYHEFLNRFPSAADLAVAELGDILRVWSGLGYNRRAKFLHRAAQQITKQYAGHFPRSKEKLVKLPGIADATAGAIVTYAFNQPVVFIETNIRTVYIHHFFNDETSIPDSKISEKIAQTLDKQNPREWYWALMDYGTYLKQTVGNLNRQSKHHTVQSKFEGSRRQLRGQVIRLLHSGPKNQAELAREISDERLESIIDGLLKEDLIQRHNKRLSL
jgi:A/G-specific adenine glycosylase